MSEHGQTDVRVLRGINGGSLFRRFPAWQSLSILGCCQSVFTIRLVCCRASGGKPIDNAIQLKPFVKWVGGKSQLVNELEKMIPLDGEKVLTKYIEPMVGGGALLFYVLSKFDFKQIYISDINAELINAYNAIKNNVNELIAKLTEMQFLFLPMDENGRKHYYYSSRDRFNSLELNES
ncbi:MAG: DNA adenine methylase, partial [Spirochaetales bacterium]|nr:DNA adenine methylase [Spirochaetales bacterium]